MEQMAGRAVEEIVAMTGIAIVRVAVPAMAASFAKTV
jgi:hypothetical protein